MKRPSQSVASRRVVTIGGDCSGLNGWALAFESLGVPYQEKFCSDINVHCRSVLEKFFDQIFEDITKRDLKRCPKVDAYGAGFPCVGFSGLGLKEGFENKESKAGLHCLMYIEEKRPHVFLLENVPDLVNKRHEDDFKVLMNFLKSIRGPNDKPQYTLKYKVVNSLHHGLGPGSTL